MIQAFPQGMFIGLIPMSGKPVHQGHYAMIEAASLADDQVIVYVSVSDRNRKGELGISGAAMSDIWRQYLEPIMPSNVTIEYGGSPVRKVYEQLGAENERLLRGELDIATYVVYSGADDMEVNFPDRNMVKYFDALWSAQLIDKQINPAAETYSREGGFTGTAMRKLLQSGDNEQFMNMLPDPLSTDAREAIWQLLTTA